MTEPLHRGRRGAAISKRGRHKRGVRPWPLLLPGLLALLPVARAQNEPGLVVQLPTVSLFSVQTTVSVPDSGGAYLGGLGYAAGGQTYLGSPLLPWAQRASGGVRRHHSLVVRATVHDLEAVDEAVLQQAARLALAEQGGKGLRHGGGSSAETPVASLTELRRRKAALHAARQQEAQAMYERGQQALAEGKVHAARGWFRMAACRARGALRAEILDALDLLAQQTATGAAR